MVCATAWRTELKEATKQNRPQCLLMGTTIFARVKTRRGPGSCYRHSNVDVGLYAMSAIFFSQIVRSGRARVQHR